MGHLTLLGSKGDERIKWDPASDDDVTRAREKFDELIKQGWNAFRLETRQEEVAPPPRGLLRKLADALRGRPKSETTPAATVVEKQVKGEQITTFDPTAAEILMVRPLRGG